MTQYDEEFEKYWEKKVAEGELAMFKPFAEMVWKDVKQAVKTPQPKVKKLDLKGGPWTIMGNGRVQADESSKDYCDAGRERKVQATAESAAKKMLKRDVLHAHATEFMGCEYEYVPGMDNYFIARSNRKYVAVHETKESLGTVYMTRACAEYLSDALNDGRLVL